MQNYTITVKRTVICTVHVEADDELEARDAFCAGDYSEGQEIEVVDEEIKSIRQD